MEHLIKHNPIYRQYVKEVDIERLNYYRDVSNFEDYPEVMGLVRHNEAQKEKKNH